VRENVNDQPQYPQLPAMLYGFPQEFLARLRLFTRLSVPAVVAAIYRRTIFGQMKSRNLMTCSHIVRCHCIRNTIFTITTFPPLG
jgi:hypothetical protein